MCFDLLFVYYYYCFWLFLLSNYYYRHRHHHPSSSHFCAAAFRNYNNKIDLEADPMRRNLHDERRIESSDLMSRLAIITVADHRDTIAASSYFSNSLSRLVSSLKQTNNNNNSKLALIEIVFQSRFSLLL